MKTSLVRCLLLVFIVTCMGCAASRTPAEEEAARRAQNLPFPGDISVEAAAIRDLVVIVPQRDLRVLRVDGAAVKGSLLDKQLVFLSPGQHTLTVTTDPNLAALRNLAPEDRSSTTAAIMTDDVSILVGQGRHHTLDYEKSRDHTDLVFTLITYGNDLAAINDCLRDDTVWMEEKKAAAKAALDNFAAYQAFSGANPDWLEGKWAVDGDEEEDMLEFYGNTVRFSLEKPALVSTRTTLEGKFIFDRNTLVILWDSMRSFVNTVTREGSPGFFVKTVWVYTRNDDTLDVKSNGIIVPAEIGGTYKRVRSGAGQTNH